MSKPGTRKIIVFLVLSAVYWVFGLLGIVFVAIGECGMGPDSPADCSGVPAGISAAIAVAFFAGLSFAFFKIRISGID